MVFWRRIGKVLFPVVAVEDFAFSVRFGVQSPGLRDLRRPVVLTRSPPLRSRSRSHSRHPGPTMPQAKERTANIDNPDGNTNSFLEGGTGHKTAVTPGINEINNKKLPLVQPEEQGESRGKVASG
jgi:hypothetical protein